MAWHRTSGNNGGKLEVLTASGDIASFETNIADVLRSVKCELSPSLTGYTAVNLTACGVNLWNEQWEVGTIRTDTGANNNTGERIRSKGYIPITPSTTYFLAYGGTVPTGAFANIVFYDENETYLGESTYIYKNLNNNSPFTSPANAYYARFVVEDFTTVYSNNISFNKGNDTQYHAYTGNTYAIALGDTYYGGVLDVTRGKLHVTHGIIDLGSLAWNKDYYSSTQKYYYYASPISEAIGYSGWTEVGNIKCDSYPTVSRRDVLTGNLGITLSANVNGGTPNIYNPDFDNAETTANDVKTAMNGVMLVYELVTPFDIDLTPEQIEALLGVNNVWHDANGNTEVKYLEVVRN